jgi:hypothetical protein
VTEAPHPPPSGGLYGFAERIFAMVDRPWKAFALAGLVLVGVLGITLWEKRAEIAETVLERYVKPRLEAERFTARFADQLLAETRADLVVLASISLADNLLKDLEGYKRDDQGWKPRPNPRPIFYADRDPRLLIGLIEGHPICGTLDAAAGEEPAMLVGLGMTRRCYIAVPPVIGKLVGALMLAWRAPLPPEAEGGAARLIYAAALDLATW